MRSVVSWPFFLSQARLRRERVRDVRHRREVDAAVSLQKSVVRGREEREAVEEVLVVDLHALREARRGIARRYEADEDRVHVDLMAVRLGAAAETASVGERRVDRRFQGDDVTR